MTDQTFTYIDPNSLYDDALDSYETLWDEYKPIWNNVSSLLDRSVLLPDNSIQAPVLVSYILCNQKWSKTLPILFLYGREGSGKSQIVKVAANLHASTIFGSDSTFASVRNELNRMKWLDTDGEKTTHRDGALLLFDNVYPQTFLLDEKLYSMILRGYEAQNDTVMIAGKDGENMEFRTFASKIISSVQPFQNTHELRELNRRMLTIRTKALRDLTAEQQASSAVEDMIDLDSLSFTGLNWRYVSFWNDAAICMKYVQLRQQLTRVNGVAQKYLKSLLSEERRKIIIDLIVTSVVTGGYQSLEASIEMFAMYFEAHDRATATDKPASFDSFKKLVDDWKTLNGESGKALPTEEVKRHAEHLNNTWGAEQRITQKEVKEVMALLGYTLDLEARGWIPAIK